MFEFRIDIIVLHFVSLWSAYFQRTYEHSRPVNQTVWLVNICTLRALAFNHLLLKERLRQFMLNDLEPNLRSRPQDPRQHLGLLINQVFANAKKIRVKNLKQLMIWNTVCRLFVQVFGKMNSLKMLFNRNTGTSFLRVKCLVKYMYQQSLWTLNLGIKKSFNSTFTKNSHFFVSAPSPVYIGLSHNALPWKITWYLDIQHFLMFFCKLICSLFTVCENR